MPETPRSYVCTVNIDDCADVSIRFEHRAALSKAIRAATADPGGWRGRLVLESRLSRCTADARKQEF